MKTLQLPVIPLRFAAERDRRSLMVRMWWRWIECAYVVLEIRGLKAEIEFPTTWHEHRIGWIRLGFGFVTIAFAFPWRRLAPDYYQCSGPQYGFAFHGDALWLYFGQNTGHSRDPRKYIAWDMPWAWRHRAHIKIDEPEEHPYRYVLRSGEVQDRIATIQAERHLWTRPWPPFKLERQSIDINFDGEVGERSGSWKGGVLGCSYDMLEGETPLTTLRRMEQERKFT